MAKKITLLIIAGNFIGASLCYLYFSTIAQEHLKHVGPQVPRYYSHLFFIIFSGLMILTFVLCSRRSSGPLYKAVEDHSLIGQADADDARRLKNAAIQFPFSVAGISFLVWILAGFIFGLLEPVITAYLFDLEPAALGEGLKRFFGITLLGGTPTSLFIYFSVENLWRRAIPAFFPDGDLSAVKSAFRINVGLRLLVVFLAISLIPIPLLGAAAYSRAVALQSAGAAARAELMTALLTEIVFLILVTIVVSALLAYFVARSVSKPLKEIVAAMKSVEKDDLDVQVDIVSNDEIGEVSDGFNRMVRGLKESAGIKESFGKYVSREIRDEILSGKLPLDGEMKRVTLLFSDLRDFTTMVERTHPRRMLTLLNRYFSEMTAAIKSCQGQVLQYVGDEIEAVFGAPLFLDDHPDLAVKAALEMKRRLERLNDEFKSQGHDPFRHGIGIHTGAALAGNIGSQDRMSYTLVGDTVNLASRIQGLTKQFGCDIILSQTTHDLLVGSFGTQQLSAVKVKGKMEEVMIYQLRDAA